MKPPKLGDLKVVFNNAMLLGTESGPQQDCLILIHLLRRCYPHVSQLYVSDAHRLMKERRLQEARDVMEEAAGRFPEDQTVKAMLALVLYWLREPTWELTLHEARSLAPDPDAAEVIAAIERLHEANLAGRRYTGKPSEASETPSQRADGAVAPMMFALRC